MKKECDCSIFEKLFREYGDSDELTLTDDKFEYVIKRKKRDQLWHNLLIYALKADVVR